MVKYLFAVMVLLWLPARAFDVELGGGTGWGAPYGTGLETHISFNKYIQLDAGFGFSMNGLKYGFGAKGLYPVDKYIALFAGVNFTRSSGLSPVTVYVYEESAQYAYKAGNVLNVKAGLLISLSFLQMYGGAGYGFVVQGGGVKLLAGDDSKDVRDFAELMELGGWEISGAMLISLKGFKKSLFKKKEPINPQ